jgi:O-acetyl-ADP-ribose deacetylase (regulator of RNase III)
MKDKVEIIQGDITKQEVDAIVNAANKSLLGGGGVDGAIHRAAGPELVAETRELGGCPTGEARISRGYRLAAKWVIHTVGPVWKGGTHNEANLLASCYKSSFQAAAQLGVKTIAFPAISTGVYGYPLEEATEIALRQTRDALKDHPDIENVFFVCFGDEAYRTYQLVYSRVFEK